MSLGSLIGVVGSDRGSDQRVCHGDHDLVPSSVDPRERELP